MSKDLIIYEKSGTGYGAYAPDLPGCVATGRTLDQTKRRMTKAIEMHLAAMREDGEEIPKPWRSIWSRSPEGGFSLAWPKPPTAGARSNFSTCDVAL
jgi:predicted RNase H-like HicB family nuclease